MFVPWVPHVAASALISSLSADISSAEPSASPLYRLVDKEEESLPSDRDLLPCKWRSVDIGDGVARAVDPVIDDFIVHETATIVLEDDIELASEVQRSVEVVEGVSLSPAIMGAEGPVVVASDNLWQEGPSTSQPADDASLPTDGRCKGVAEDSYETGLDLEVRL